MASQRKAYDDDLAMLADIGGAGTCMSHAERDLLKLVSLPVVSFQTYSVNSQFVLLTVAVHIVSGTGCWPICTLVFT